jgi:hypothetical protein
MMDARDRDTEPVMEALRLPPDRGGRFAEEWAVVRRRIAVVHAADISHEVEPAGAPRLARPE